MMKKIFLLFITLILVFMFVGCDSVSNSINDLQGLTVGYDQFKIKHNPYIPESVIDTLDHMLEDYVSGVGTPQPSQIVPISVPDDIDDDDIEDSTSSDGTSIDTNVDSRDELRKLLLNSLSNTDEKLTFTISGSLLSENVKDLLYDVIFEDLAEHEMIETMGLSSYVYGESVNGGSSDKVVYVEYTYFNNECTVEETKQMKTDALSKAKQVCTQLNLANLDDYGKIKEINQYLCDNVEYSSSQPYTYVQHSLYGALINGDCVCDGYAKATKLLMDLSGLNGLYICGDAGGIGHAWNMIMLDNQYYQLDVTWNDESNNAYFLVTDDYMSLSRTWDTNKYPKSADKPYV